MVPRILSRILMLVILTVALTAFAHNGSATVTPRPFQQQAAIAQNGKVNFSDIRRRIHEKLIELRNAGGFPGMTVGVAAPDGRSVGVSIGYADLESKLALKPADRMLAGSIGKTYVSAVTLRLVEVGKLNLDDKIVKWLGKEPW